jgi:phosphohistidine phosphatase
MKTLTLLRHAKAVEATTMASDHERPLRPRGLRDALAVGCETKAPDLVLCSTAVRTRETLAMLSEGWATAPRTLYEDALYLASAQTLYRLIERLDTADGSVWLIGHNPGIHDLARRLAGVAIGQGRHPALMAHFPTSARATFTIDADDWADLALAPITLTGFAVPSSV